MRTKVFFPFSAIFQYNGYGKELFRRMSIRSSKDVKRELLKRAIKEGRGPEMILLIQWRNAWLKHEAERDVDGLHKFEGENFAQPRSVRMLNVLAAHEGRAVRYGDAAIDRMLVDMPEALH